MTLIILPDNAGYVVLLPSGDGWAHYRLTLGRWPLAFPLWMKLGLRECGA